MPTFYRKILGKLNIKYLAQQRGAIFVLTALHDNISTQQNPDIT